MDMASVSCRFGVNRPCRATSGQFMQKSHARVAAGAVLKRHDAEQHQQDDDAERNAENPENDRHDVSPSLFMTKRQRPDAAAVPY
jgi:hypothetical protein